DAPEALDREALRVLDDGDRGRRLSRPDADREEVVVDLRERYAAEQAPAVLGEIRAHRAAERVALVAGVEAADARDARRRDRVALLEREEHGAHQAKAAPERRVRERDRRGEELGLPLLLLLRGRWFGPLRRNGRDRGWIQRQRSWDLTGMRRHD